DEGGREQIAGGPEDLAGAALQGEGAIAVLRSGNDGAVGCDWSAGPAKHLRLAHRELGMLAGHALLAVSADGVAVGKLRGVAAQPADAAVETINGGDESAIGGDDDLPLVDARRTELPEFFGIAGKGAAVFAFEIFGAGA